MDALRSKTSIFYQAMPAVGADGKNIMKLIPVKRVNGQFYQTEAPQRGVAVYNHASPVHVPNKSVVTSSNHHQFIRKQVPAATASSNQIHPAHRDSKGPPQQQGVCFTNRLPQNVSPSTRLSRQLTVTVKSPALPRGQFLKIPPDAQVQRIPASELPPVIKDQIVTSSSSSASPTVVYVSPVTIVDHGVTTSHKLPSNTGACGPPPTRAKPQLKLVPKFSERPNSPIRWVIEEAESLEHLGPAPLTSQNPQSAAETPKETGKALVMFDGRVFFVANKNGSVLKSTTVAQTASRDPAVPQTSQNRRGPNDSHDVIDLCDDDDAPKNSSQRAPPSKTTSYQDEDNVIFVSYIPPKPESDSLRTVPAEVPAQREGGQQGTFVCRETGLCSTVTDRTESQRSVLDQQLETGSPADPSSREEPAQTAQNSEPPAPSWTSPTGPEPCQRSDPQLRKMFGITADVKIYLQQVNEAAAGRISADSRTFEDEEKEPSPQDSYSPNGLPEFSKPSPGPPPASEGCWSGRKRLSEAEAVIGYVEPIDEDISDESDTLSKLEIKPVPLETCVDISPNTRRVGRTRKRTLCPCCVPAALHPAVKSGLRLEELERWTFISEQTVRRVGRTKASRKDGRTSAKIRYRNCKIHEAPGSRGSSSTSVDLFKTSSG